MQEVLSKVERLAEAAALQSRMNSVLSGLSILGECKSVNVHRHLAFFDITLSPGASVSKLTSKVREIAIGIRSKSIPIARVIPENGIVRLQVALRDADLVNVEQLWFGTTFRSNSMLPIILGESDSGEKLVVDFAKNPHTLIAGGTGSGKSVLLHNIISNLIYLNFLNIRNVDIYLIDPKQVEFSQYSSKELSDHVINVINDYNASIDLLEFLEHEMNDRYDRMKSYGFRSLDECPKLFSQIVVIIDEVADLMIQDKKLKKFEKLVVKLAQKSRACGIHLILATQRPSVDIITGLIKANFPARIACKTASKVDSQVILDYLGAEHLMGRGDAIIRNMNYDNVRFQVAYADPKNTTDTLNNNIFSV